jgi:DNA helicase HerA-like ATPase
MQLPPEHLGSFYLGAEYDLQRGTHTAIPLNYDSRDLTTHALCVGMTGSGKTGLCLALLEEAAIDNVPAILIDPKGDISNLVLQFPDLSPEDFAPWIDQDQAQRQEKTTAEYAADVAARWRQGIETWGMSSKRLRTLKEAADYTIYTPGSDAGLPMNILGSLAAPGLNFDEQAEIIRERISGTVNALLGFIGISADPIQSREAILLSNIFEHFWRQNQDLNLTQLILSIQNPPVRQLGVLDVDTFYPEKERFELAMAFNNLVASPKFQNWLQGEALEIDSLLYTAEGKPRHSIFYIAHLSDKERMFFVTLLLETVLAWVRRQAGTNSLRALLYFDEVYGYLPPVAKPSSKRPLMALLKQGRAVGLGCVLATQNPADVDYKGLTNTGTWFIGRLQAERDKARVIEGLKSAIAEAGREGERVDYDRIIGQLKPRVFLMHNVHEEEPAIFQTRWVMSYLHGPLTRPQIQALMARRKDQEDIPAEARVQPAVAAPPAPTARRLAPQTGFSPNRQVLDPGIPQLFLPVTEDESGVLSQAVQGNVRVNQAQLVYGPAILGGATVRFFDRKQGISEQRERLLLAPPPEVLGTVDWNEAQALSIPLSTLEQEPARLAPGQGPFFAPVPEAANSAPELKNIAQAFADWLYYNSQLTLLAHSELDVVQRPEETERQFKLRLRQAARERRDAEVDRLREKYAARMERLETKLRKEKREWEQDQADYAARKRESWIATGEMLLTLMRRRRMYRTVSWNASRRRLANRAKMEVEESQQEIEDLEAELTRLQQELEQEIRHITPKWVDILKALTTYPVRPRRADINVRIVGLAWVPSWVITYVEGGRSLSATLPAYPHEPNSLSV